MILSERTCKLAEVDHDLSLWHAQRSQCTFGLLRTKVSQHYANMRLAPDEVPASHYDGNIVFAPDEVPSTSYYPYLGFEVLGRTLQAQDRIIIAEQQSIVWSMQCTQHISTIVIDRSV